MISVLYVLLFLLAINFLTFINKWRMVKFQRSNGTLKGIGNLVSIVMIKVLSVKCYAQSDLRDCFYERSQ